MGCAAEPIGGGCLLYRCERVDAGGRADAEQDAGAWGRDRFRIQPERSGVWILNATILVFLAFAAPNFYGRGNIEAVLNDTAILGIGAAGMTVLIMAGAFDLSVTA